MSTYDDQPSLRLELAAATAQWAVQHGAKLHEHLRLEEREGRGICLVAVDAIDANTTIIRFNIIIGINVVRVVVGCKLHVILRWGILYKLRLNKVLLGTTIR